MMTTLLPWSVLAVCYASASDVASMPSYMNAQDASSSMEQLNNTGALALEADEALALADSKLTGLMVDVQEGIEGLTLYCAEIAYGANVHGNATMRMISFEDLEAAAAPIYTAVTVAGGTCEAGYAHVESCLHTSVCMLEPEVEKSIPTHIFAVFVESTGQVAPAMADLPDLPLTPVSVLERDCGSPSFLDEFSASSERQWNAVSTASLVEQASAAFQKADTETLGPESFQNIWHSACAALKCDAGSMLDIIHAVNGHAAELIAVKAPAALIRSYLIAIRKNEVSIKRMDGQMTERLSAILTADSSHEHATARYDQSTKRATGALSRARTILLQQTAGFWDDLVSFLEKAFSCFGFMITKAVAYGRTPIMFTTPCYCFGIVISLAAFVPINWSYAGGKNAFLTTFKHLWEGLPFCLACPLVFILSMCIGFVIQPPKPAGLTELARKGSTGIGAKIGVTPFPKTPGWQNAQLRAGIALTISLGFKPVKSGEDLTGTEQANEEDFTEEEMDLYGNTGVGGENSNVICETHVMLGISVGLLGLIAVGYPTCVFGSTVVVLGIMFLCLKAWALSVTILCCSLNLTTGDNSCEGGGGCSKSPTGCALGRRRKRRQDIRDHGFIKAWEMRNGGKIWTGRAQVKRRQRCNKKKRKAGNCKSYWVRLKEAQAKIDLLITRREEWKQDIYDDQVMKQEKAAKKEALKEKAEFDKTTGQTGGGGTFIDDCDAACKEERRIRREARWQANHEAEMAKAREDCKKPCNRMHDYHEQWECNQHCDSMDWDQIVDHPTYEDQGPYVAPYVPTYSSCEEGCNGMHDDREMQECFWECR